MIRLLHIFKKIKVKLKNDTFKELGKFFFNLALALVVFTFIQPLAEGSLNVKNIAIGFIISIFAFLSGIYFTNKSS